MASGGAGEPPEKRARSGPQAPARAPALPDKAVERVRNCKVIPVIKIEDAAHGVPLVRALLAGGIDVAEITLRTPCAMDAIGEVARQFGDQVCVGAGTVLEPDQVDLAVNAGSDFIVSPGFSPRVAERCRQLGVLYLPGAATPTEVMRAVYEFDLKVLKFFPASNCGGVGMLKSLGSVFSDVIFMPTGGITAANVKDYVSLPNVFAAGGSWMVSDTAVKKASESGDWSEVEKGAREARASALG